MKSTQICLLDKSKQHSNDSEVDESGQYSFIRNMIYLLIRWMNTSRAKYSIIGTYFLTIFVCSRIMKEYPQLCDKIECYKSAGCNPMKKDRLIRIDRCHLAIIMTIFVRLKPTLSLKLCILRQNFFACFLLFLLSGWIVMKGTKHTSGKCIVNFCKLFAEFGFYSERQEFSLRISAIQDTSLNDGGPDSKENVK